MCKMNILIGKCFGIGNCILTVPLIKSLKSMGHNIDVLVGTTPDDGGSINVFQYLVADGLIDNLYVNSAIETLYDVAIMAIPFDGRWVEGIHFNAKEVLDGRPRPIPSTIGLVSWEKHEVEYMMENAYALGYEGEVPDCSFIGKKQGPATNVYIGVGYKKDKNGFWKRKHWGNDNFANLITKLFDLSPDIKVFSTGDISDWNYSLKDIKEKVNNDRYVIKIENLDSSFKVVQDCGVYIGNDSGFMHVAASLGLLSIVPFFIENSIIKNKPFKAPSFCIDANLQEPTCETIFKMFSHVFDMVKKFGEF